MINLRHRNNVPYIYSHIIFLKFFNLISVMKNKQFFNNRVLLCADNLRRRCTWFHQSAEKQVQVQTLLQEAPTVGVPASPDRVRGGRPRQVRTALSQSDLVLYLPLWKSPHLIDIYLRPQSRDFLCVWFIWDDFDHIKVMMIWHWVFWNDIFKIRISLELYISISTTFSLVHKDTRMSFSLAHELLRQYCYLVKFFQII